MSVWNLKYQTQYTTQSDANNAEKTHTLQFLFKDYIGGQSTVTGADVTVIQKCTVDDPVAAIKGQSLEIKLINAGNIPLTAFYSEDDDGVQVKLLDENNDILFIGFLVQDDSYELLVDFQHTISLSANDSLGLLKGVILSDTQVKTAFDETIICTNGPLNEILISTAYTSFNPVIGNTVTVQGVDYVITAISTVPITIGGRIFNFTLTVTPSVAAPIVVSEHEIIYLLQNINLYQRNSLLTLIAACLYSTNLRLITNVYCGILETHNDPTKSAFEQVLLDSQVFISGETFDNCYTTLEKILTAFRCTLFQAYGQWQIIHWTELSMFPNGAIPGYQYDEDFTLQGTITLNNNFNVGPEPQLTRPVYGITEGILRPYKFDRKQFDYKQPKYLLLNYDFLQLGDLITEYTTGGKVYKEYVATSWLLGYGTNTQQRFIRVVYDLVLGNEIERYLVLRGTTFDSSRSVLGTPFEGQLGDKLTFSFSFRTWNGSPFTTVVFALMAYDGTNTKYVQDTPVDNGAWLTTLGFSFVTPGTNDTWNGVSIKSSGIPYDGYIYPYLANANQTPLGSDDETHYRDIRMEYQPFINESTKIIGQIHKDEQTPNIKNNSDVIINIDDSPKNQIAGTLFLTTKTGLLQNRTVRWGYNNGTENWRLGELNTMEELLWRSRSRSKLEGGFIGNIQSKYISILAPVITTFKPTKVYTFGLLSIDYKRNQCSGTLWEITDSGDPVLDDTYTFTYIYDTK